MQLPDVTGELQSVRNALNDINLNQLIVEGQERFDDITQSITPIVDDRLGSEWT